MTSKDRKCPACGEVAWSDQDWHYDDTDTDTELVWGWKCTQCFHTAPIKKRKKLAEDAPLNTRQEATLEELKVAVVKGDCNGRPDEYEVKKWDVNVTHGVAYVVSVVGRIGDEGTYGALFSRTRRHIRVGRKGGLELLNPGRYDKKAKEIVRSKAKVVGWKSAWALTK